MRACFLGENICALGFGVAIVQTPPLEEPDAAEPRASFPADFPLENLMTRAWRRRPEIVGQFLRGDPSTGLNP